MRESDYTRFWAVMFVIFWIIYGLFYVVGGYLMKKSLILVYNENDNVQFVIKSQKLFKSRYIIFNTKQEKIGSVNCSTRKDYDV